MRMRAGQLPDEDPRPPLLDLEQRRLILPRHLVPVGLLLFEGRRTSDAPDVATGVAELERAGIVGHGELHPFARDLLSPIASPQAVVSVEISGSGPLEIATIWCAGRRCTLGASQDRKTFELYPLEPGLIPFHLAALTRAGLRPADEKTPITIGTDLLTQTVTTAATDPDDACSRLQAQGLDADTAARIVRLLTAPSRRWRISTLWREPDGFIGDRALEIIDGGPLGYWEVTQIPKNDNVVLTPRSLDSVLRLFAAALPDG